MSIRIKFVLDDVREHPHFAAFERIVAELEKLPSHVQLDALVYLLAKAALISNVQPRQIHAALDTTWEMWAEDAKTTRGKA